MAKGVSHGDEVEGFIAEGKMFAETAAELDAGGFGIFTEHAGAGIEADDVGFGEAELQGGASDEAGAGGDIEQLHAGGKAGFAQGGAAIIAIAAEGHDPADPVVVLRGGIEKMRDVVRALGGTGIKFSERPVGPLGGWRC